MINRNKLSAYVLASTLSDKIWFIVSKWPILAQKTIGGQLIRSIDSVAANIIEGEGRYYKKDKVRFYYQSRGSAYESEHWFEKAKSRNLITNAEYDEIITELKNLPKEINFLISNTFKNLKK